MIIMSENRFRFVYGTTHDECVTADGNNGEYICSEIRLVKILNQLDEQNQLMENKLNELGFRLFYKMEDYDMTKKSFKPLFKEHPQDSDNGEWVLLSDKQYEKIKEQKLLGDVL